MKTFSPHLLHKTPRGYASWAVLLLTVIFFLLPLKRLPAVPVSTRSDPSATNNHGSITLPGDFTVENKPSATGYADLSVSISTNPEPVQVNGALTYSITITNNGPRSASGVSLHVTVPPGLNPGSFIAVSIPSGWKITYNYKSGLLSLSGSCSFESGASATLVFKVFPTATALGSVWSTTATVCASTRDKNLTNNTATAYTSVISNDATLSALACTAGALTPLFASATTSYTVTVPYTTTSATITPTTKDPNAIVKVRINSGVYIALTSGSVSPELALNVGGNPVEVQVTARDGVTVKTYTLVITREPSDNADLSHIHLSTDHSPLTPAFAPEITSYATTVGNDITSLTITPTTADTSATVKINEIPVPSGTASAGIPLSVGGNLVSFMVTAQDGITTKIYTLTITRKPSNNAYLSYIHLSTDHSPLSPAFTQSITRYTTIVGYDINSLTATPTASDTSATVKVNGISLPSGTASQDIHLNVGDNVITFVVTAQDGITAKTYTLTITRKPSDNAYLSYIHLSVDHSPLSPAFAPETTSYTASVSHATTSLTVTPTTSNTSATVKINTTLVPSGTASQKIPLKVGDNVITFLVKAQDGVTTKTYKLTITRRPSRNAYLSYIHLSTDHSPLTPAFAPDTTSYAASVAYKTTSLTATPTTSNTAAVVKVNGTQVASGTPSQSIPLNVGENVITFLVTAQDGITTRTYTLTITRKPSDDAHLSDIGLNTSHSALSPSFNENTSHYTTSVDYGISSLSVTPVTRDTSATIKVNGMPVISATASADIPLGIGDNIITFVVTAQDSVTTKTYTLTVTRAAPPSDYNVYQPVSVVKPLTSLPLEDDAIVVHQGLSPNGDGINDVLTIDGIRDYPDNKLIIISSNGTLVYETKGYDNGARVFDGHSNKTGFMLRPGTYFYSLDYTAKGISKHKTGFIMLKY